MIKTITLCCCLIAFVACDVSELSSEYLPPIGGDIQQHHGSGIGISEPSNEYLAPAEYEPQPGHSFSDDEGYRYRTGRRNRVVLRNRNRRVFRNRNRRVVYKHRRY